MLGQDVDGERGQHDAGVAGAPQEPADEVGGWAGGHGQTIPTQAPARFM